MPDRLKETSSTEKVMSSQRLAGESELATSGREAVPIRSPESELAKRIADVVGEEPAAVFGRRCGINESLLRKYMGGTVPSLFRGAAIAEAANVSLEWLATGRGEKKRGAAAAQPGPAPVVFDDQARLQATVEAVEEGLRSINRKLPPAKYAELVAAAYTLMNPASPSTAGVVQFIRAAA